MGARHGDTAANHTDLLSGCGRTCVFDVQAWSNLRDLILEPPSHYSMTPLLTSQSPSPAVSSPRARSWWRGVPSTRVSREPNFISIFKEVYLSKLSNKYTFLPPSSSSHLLAIFNTTNYNILKSTQKI